MNKPKLWLTYAWLDNQDSEIEYIANKIESKNIDVYIDKEKLEAGKRLWPQIDKFISNPSETDAWALFVTKNALESQPCQEELCWALDRALRLRGADFPLIGIFKEPIDRDLLPSALATRLHVYLSDPNWLERVSSSLHKQPLGLRRGDVKSIWMDLNESDGEVLFRCKPRIGTWPSAFIGFPEGLVNSDVHKNNSKAKFDIKTRKGFSGKAERAVMLSLRKVCGEITNPPQDIPSGIYDYFIIDGPFDQRMEMIVDLGNYEGPAVAGGIAGEEIIDPGFFFVKKGPVSDGWIYV